MTYTTTALLTLASLAPLRTDPEVQVAWHDEVERLPSALLDGRLHAVDHLATGEGSRTVFAAAGKVAGGEVSFGADAQGVVVGVVSWPSSVSRKAAVHDGSAALLAAMERAALDPAVAPTFPGEADSVLEVRPPTVADSIDAVAPGSFRSWGPSAAATLETATSGLLGHAYTLDGYVGREGSVREGGLCCSSFVSAVLHKLRDGDGWLAGYSLKVHKWYGDRIAEHFRLVPVGSFGSSKLLDPKTTRAMIESGLLPSGTYMFDARSGASGHVGFLTVARDGTLTQSHYSSLASGHMDGDFRGWLRRSRYRGATVDLYRLPVR